MLLRPSRSLFVLSLVGCGPEGNPAGPAGAWVDAVDGSDSTPGSDGNAAPGDFSGLPCEVASLLGEHCTGCHGATPVGAPMSLLTLQDLKGDSKSSPGQSYAALSVVRMRSADKPMPPSGARVPESELRAFELWVEAGMPEGSCGDVTDPFDTPVTCTTDSYWTRGDKKSERMHPGVACIDCHRRGVADDDGEVERGPEFGFAGTVYATAHEPNDCNGADGKDGVVRIEVTDAEGFVHRAEVNDVGNFFFEDTVRYPITARVLYQGRERVMGTPQDSGDCNGCHTESGDDGAPGRIMLP